VKLYVARIAEIEALEEKALPMLEQGRRQKIKGIRRREDRLRSIYAGLLLRYGFLQEGYSVQEWEQIQITYGENGKPTSVLHPTFCFSLSHSGEYVACGVDRCQLGVDLQWMKPWNINVTKRFFAAEEYERLCKISNEEEQKKQFYQMWTAKESYVKLTGDGIGKGINQYITDENYQLICDEAKRRLAVMKIYEDIEEYMLCCCTKDGELCQEVQMISIDTLMNGM